MSLRANAGKPAVKKNVRFNLENNEYQSVNNLFWGVGSDHHVYSNDENTRNGHIDNDEKMEVVARSRKTHNRWGDLGRPKSYSMPRLPGRRTTAESLLLSKKIAHISCPGSHESPKSKPRNDRDHEQRSPIHCLKNWAWEDLQSRNISSRFLIYHLLFGSRIQTIKFFSRSTARWHA
jgi:hypothetical protein